MLATTRTTPANRIKTSNVELALDELLAAALKRGFHGTIAVEVVVMDGTIQNIRRRYEQLEK